MNLYVSYFYQVRFMRMWEVPLSTAVWDPKWFHNFKGQELIFNDKRGVINGLRASMFAPDDSCSSLCRGTESCSTKDPTQCAFLRKYAEQLRRIDFVDLMANMTKFSKKLQDAMRLEVPVDFVLLVHEAPSSSCSERVALQAWFRENGVELKEWKKQ